MSTLEDKVCATLAATRIASSMRAVMAGSSTIPMEWVAQSDEAAKSNPYSCSNLTIRETTDGMLQALRERAAKAQRLGERLLTQETS